jgi:Protein of unknown function (DUF1566)/Domain of unknown function (DUF5011)
MSVFNKILGRSVLTTSIVFVLLTACSGGSVSTEDVAVDFSAYGVKGTVNGQNITIDLSGQANCSTTVENMLIGINANGASISPDPRVARDYSQPVQFTLTAPDGTKVVYSINVKGAACLPTPPPTPDTTPPVITVLGTNPLSLTVGIAYAEAGATCVDNKDPSCTVVNTGIVNTAAVGSYTITYKATDVAGNVSSTTRTIYVTSVPAVPCTAAPIGSTGYSVVFKGCSAANMAEYYDKTECVRDNATGLIWQGQTPAGTGIRANDQNKTNYDSTTALQKPTIDGTTTRYIPPAQTDIDAITNSIGYKNAVNATDLCGSSAWRLPIKDELLSIVKTGARAPALDLVWFPNTSPNQLYWSSSQYPDYSYYAYYVDFYFGEVGGAVRGYGDESLLSMPVRLVR